MTDAPPPHGHEVAGETSTISSVRYADECLVAELVERWFGEITRKRSRRGVFTSVPKLVSAIDEFIRVNNKNPTPFVWTQPVDERLKKIPHDNAVIETPP